LTCRPGFNHATNLIDARNLTLQVDVSDLPLSVGHAELAFGRTNVYGIARQHGTISARTE
jgi:hypothetical protein